MNTHTSFWASLPEHSQLSQAMMPEHQVDVPSDWLLFATDVRNSTGAIARGAYQSVNTAGILCIVATRHAAGESLPFVFGGDGATIAAPPRARQSVRSALAGTAKSIQRTLGLDLRIGEIPVADVTTQGHGVRVAKLRLGPTAVMAVFGGTGLQQAEDQLKTEPARSIPLEEASEPNFSDYECRWQPVQPHQGKVASLILSGPEHSYPALLRDLETLLGSPLRRNPVQESSLKLSWSLAKIRREAHVKGAQASRVWLLTQLGRLFMAMRYRQGTWNWGSYRQNMSLSCDFQKCDGSLRMVVRVDDDSVDPLKDLLDSHSQNGIQWGMHLSKSALITCMVRDYGNDHIHFVDGADGGYALAALQLKEKRAFRA